jgi:hypothetical protein
MNQIVSSVASNKFLSILVASVCVVIVLSLMLSATHLKRHRAQSFRKADCCHADPEVYLILWISTVHYRNHKISALVLD